VDRKSTLSVLTMQYGCVSVVYTYYVVKILSDVTVDCIPLTGPESGLLPMHFMVDPGPDVDWNNLPEDNLKLKQILDLISTYLDVGDSNSCWVGSVN